MTGSTELMVRETITEVRSLSVRTEIGYALIIGRENLVNFLSTQQKKFEILFDKYLSKYQLVDLVSFVTSVDEYYKVKKSLKKNNFKVNYPLKEENKPEQPGEDSDDPEKFKDFDPWNESPAPKVPVAKKGNVKPIKSLVHQKEEKDKFLPQTAFCFIKISTLKKQAIDATLKAVLDQLKAELLSIRMVRANKDIYNQNISDEVKHIFKQVAHKFNEDATNLKLRKKIHDFKCILLLIRG